MFILNRKGTEMELQMAPVNLLGKDFTCGADS